MIRPKEETLITYRQALKVDFLTKEERYIYFVALMEAKYWLKKIDEQNEMIKKKNRYP